MKIALGHRIHANIMYVTVGQERRNVLDHVLMENAEVSTRQYKKNDRSDHKFDYPNLLLF